MRDMKKAAERGAAIMERRPGLSLRLGEVNQLLDEFQGTIAREPEHLITAAWHLLGTAYSAGLAVGIRNAK